MYDWLVGDDNWNLFGLCCEHNQPTNEFFIKTLRCWWSSSSSLISDDDALQPIT